MKPLIINLPLSREDYKKLKIGKAVLLNGVVYTARDLAHKKISDLIKVGKPLPFPLKNSAIYYTGPAPTKDKEIIGPCGPTTSYRMDPYTPLLLSQGLKVMIGKGERNETVIKKIKESSAVYFVTIGGIASLLKNSVVENETIAFPELGPEAVRKLVIKNFPCFVKNM